MHALWAGALSCRRCKYLSPVLGRHLLKCAFLSHCTHFLPKTPQVTLFLEQPLYSLQTIFLFVRILCPHIEISGAYCITGVHLSVFLSVSPKRNVKT